jgi:hypothetical protein
MAAAWSWRRCWERQSGQRDLRMEGCGLSFRMAAMGWREPVRGCGSRACRRHRSRNRTLYGLS